MPHWYAVVSNYTVTQYAPSSSQPWLHVNPEVVVAMCCLPPPCNTEIPLPAPSFRKQGIGECHTKTGPCWATGFFPSSLLHSPTPHCHHLSGGPWVNGSECHCEGTAQKQTPKGTSEVTVSLNFSVLASNKTFFLKCTLFFCLFFFLGASRLTPWGGVCWFFFLLLFYRVNEGCLHLQRWASLDW